MREMTVALIISTYNNPAYLRVCLMTALNQTVMPDEIIIADDGSKPDTKQLIDNARGCCRVPLIHVWHEDKGFRLSEIRNKAIAASKSDYILQVDGDVLLDRHFVEDHIAISKPGYWVSGSRTLLSEQASKHLVRKYQNMPFDTPVNIKSSIGYRRMKPTYIFNSMRIRVLRHVMRHRYAVKKVTHLRGCNMAFFKSDVIKVNGFNETLKSWGHEDSEFAYRLFNAGVKKQSLKMGGVQFHLYHKLASRDNERRQWEEVEKVKKNGLVWCSDGIDKHL